MHSNEFYSTYFFYVLIFAFLQIVLAILPGFFHSKTTKKNFSNVFFSFLIAGILIAECVFVFKALFSDCYIPVVSEFKYYVEKSVNAQDSLLITGRDDFVYYVLLGTLMTFSLSVTFKGIAFALSIVHKNVWHNVAVRIIKIAVLVIGTFFVVYAIVKRYQPLSFGGIIIYLFLLGLIALNIIPELLDNDSVWSTVLGAGLSCGLYFVFSILDWLCVKIDWLGTVLVIIFILVFIAIIISVAYSVYEYLSDIYDKIFGHKNDSYIPANLDYNPVKSSKGLDLQEDSEKKTYHHVKTIVKSTSTYHDGLYDIDYDATFYFRNGYGNETTKNASGRINCVTSDYLSTSDVEYRHSYMLNDFQ